MSALNLGTILGKQSATSTTIVAKERLWLAADGQTIVPDGDPRAATLLAAPGAQIPPRLAERLGITAASLSEAATPSIPPAEIKSRKTRVVDPETR